MASRRRFRQAKGKRVRTEVTPVGVVAAIQLQSSWV